MPVVDKRLLRSTIQATACHAHPGALQLEIWLPRPQKRAPVVARRVVVAALERFHSTGGTRRSSMAL